MYYKNLVSSSEILCVYPLIFLFGVLILYFVYCVSSTFHCCVPKKLNEVALQSLLSGVSVLRGFESIMVGKDVSLKYSCVKPTDTGCFWCQNEGASFMFCFPVYYDVIFIGLACDSNFNVKIHEVTYQCKKGRITIR